MTYKLALPIEEGSYSFTEPASYQAVPTKGGLSRARALFSDGSLQLQLSWTLSADQYSLFMSFYNIATNYGNDAFLIDLVIDTADLTEYTANFLTGPQLVKITGLIYTVSAKLEVAQATFTDDFDAGIVALYGAGRNPIFYLSKLSEIVNEDWPS